MSSITISNSSDETWDLPLDSSDYDEECERVWIVINEAIDAYMSKGSPDLFNELKKLVRDNGRLYHECSWHQILMEHLHRINNDLNLNFGDSSMDRLTKVVSLIPIGVVPVDACGVTDTLMTKLLIPSA